MALLNSSNYDKLKDVSASATKYNKGNFFTIFITGDVRDGEDLKKMQCKSDVENGWFLIQNAEKILFIPYYIKRFWEKYEETSIKPGSKSWPKLVAFGWNDDVKKIDDTCKFAYVIAGLALDPETKKAMKHTKDIPDSNIKAGDPVLIYFKCAGIKFNGGMKFLEQISSAAEKLAPLSDDIEFEKKVIYPRRFICSASVGIQPSEHGNKNVFDFRIENQLPDKGVEQVMNSAVDLLPEFEKQFDKTAYVKNGFKPTSKLNNEDVGATQMSDDDLSFGDELKNDTESEENNSEDFSLGI